MSSESAESGIRFRDLALPETLQRALDEVGYESPSPIQAQTIPHLLAGRDVLGQAQTGTGKTAAFALPALARTELFHAVPQTLVLAPTRELAIQVAEAFQRYAVHLPGFHVLPIYGGQSYEPQLKGLRRGVHAVVGTPGRVVDHIKRGTLKLDALKMLVLDEADEMLRMGFIEDVEWVLTQTPPERQVALFSATMPSVIRRVAQTHLRDPAEIHIRSKTTTATNIRQRYWLVAGASKLEALTRVLEAETFDGMLIFARTKLATAELAEKLAARGFAAAALNGDLDQKQRERTVARLKDGQLDIVVATDVAARGLDVERISHVVNYDIPTDTESYVHRIGRTGRAGRSGEAILFVSPRERHLLKAIERATRQVIEPMALPSDEVLQDKRLQRFQQALLDVLGDAAQIQELTHLQGLIERIERDQQLPAARIAAALARLLQKEKPALVPPAASARKAEEFTPSSAAYAGERPPSARPRPRREVLSRDDDPTYPPRVPPAPGVRLVSPPPAAIAAMARPASAAPAARPVESAAAPRTKPSREDKRKDDEAMETFRVEVGEKHGVKPANLVGAIANEAGLEGQYIGRIDIQQDHSFIDLPAGMPRKIFRDLQKVWVSGQQLRISRVGAPEHGKKDFKKVPKPRRDA